MRKMLYLLLLLVTVLCGCRRDNESDMAGIGSRRSSAIGIIGSIAAPDTRTLLDGLTIRWAERDSIGLFNANAKNSPAWLTASSAGSTEALFTAEFAYGAPKYAYYPYREGAACTNTSVSLTLPANQIQSGPSPDMRYDLKTGSFTGGDAAGNYMFEFREKMAILWFVLTPGNSLEGDRLESITFIAEGRPLAGDYILKMDRPEEPLDFAQGASSTVNLAFASAPVLTASGTVEGWMFVNPSVVEGDAIRIKVKTDNHTVTADLAASKDYRAGYRYRMPLDVASLAASGKAVVLSNEPAFDITPLSQPGVIDLTSASYTCKYGAGINQYALYSKAVSGSEHSFFRIQSLPGAYAVEMSVTAYPSVGSEVQLSVTSCGLASVTSGIFTAKVMKINADLVWLFVAENQTGYILMRR